MPYHPQMSAERVAALRRWHEEAYRQLRERGEVEVHYLGLDLVVPAEVFAPTPVSDLLGNAVLSEVRTGDRVLDVGTGCGVNAILAASRSTDVIGVDINPMAADAARENAARNGVAERTRFRAGDLFDEVPGTFDLMIFDPPFRWFAPRNLLEASIADEDYTTLTRFFEQAADHLRPGGRVLLFFGTSGDMDYLMRLIDRSSLNTETLAERPLRQEGETVIYRTFRLSR